MFLEPPGERFEDVFTGSDTAATAIRIIEVPIQSVFSVATPNSLAYVGPTYGEALVCIPLSER